LSNFKNVTLRERIYDEVVQMILNRELAPGAQIDERALSEKLSVSRTPFREALGTLANDGLIETKPYRGTFVRELAPKQINDLYEVRKNLEGLAVRLAVPQLTDEQIDVIEGILDNAVAALRRQDMATYAALDRQFHETFPRVANNETLSDTLARLSRQIQLCRVFANKEPDVAERTATERTAILKALRAKDAEQAAFLMTEHIAGVQRAVMSMLSAQSDGVTTDDAKRVLVN
jgi:DNA-binding GntR family transcriptional regulator